MKESIKTIRARAVTAGKGSVKKNLTKGYTFTDHSTDKQISISQAEFLNLEAAQIRRYERQCEALKLRNAQDDKSCELEAFGLLAKMILNK